MAQISSLLGHGVKQKSFIARDRLLGPVFGCPDKTVYRRYDLRIVGKANEYRQSSSCLGGCYECPEGKDGALFLTGTPEFLVADYEVFELY